MFFRRRMRMHVVELSPPPNESVRLLSADEVRDRRGQSDTSFNAAGAVGRIERFVGAASASLGQLESRIAHLEVVTAELAEELHARPSHGDLLEVRLQASRVEAEVRRLGTELRGEVDEIKDITDARNGGGSPDMRRRGGGAAS